MVTTEPKPAEVPVASPDPDASARPVGPLVLKLPPEWRLTDDAFDRLGSLNEMLDLERTAEGELVIAPPPVGPSPRAGSRVHLEVGKWADAGGGGYVGESSQGYRLGAGSAEFEPENDKVELRVPDVSWISQEQFDALTDFELEDGYPSLAPSFVVEVVSKSQTLASQERKMDMWMSYGVQLGWLIDPKRELVWIYRAGQDEPEFLERPDTLSGEDVLQGFTLDCSLIWS